MPVGAPASAGQVVPTSRGQPASGALTTSHRLSTRVAPSPHGCSESMWMHAPRAAVAAIAGNHRRGNAVFVMSELNGLMGFMGSGGAVAPMRKRSSCLPRHSEARSVCARELQRAWTRQAPAQNLLEQEGRHSESHPSLREFAGLSSMSLHGPGSSTTREVGVDPRVSATLGRRRAPVRRGPSPRSGEDAGARRARCRTPPEAPRRQGPAELLARLRESLPHRETVCTPYWRGVPAPRSPRPREPRDAPALLKRPAWCAAPSPLRGPRRPRPSASWT